MCEFPNLRVNYVLRREEKDSEKRLVLSSWMVQVPLVRYLKKTKRMWFPVDISGVNGSRRGICHFRRRNERARYARYAFTPQLRRRDISPPDTISIGDRPRPGWHQISQTRADWK